MSNKPLKIFQCIAILVACNYFAFRTELFREEFEESQSAVTADRAESSITALSVNWESFDTDNAPKAFVCNPLLPIQLLYVTAPEHFYRHPRLTFSFPVRDKSPPRLSAIPV